MKNYEDLLLSQVIKFAIYECLSNFAKLQGYFLNLKNPYVLKKFKIKKLSTIWENPNM